MADTCKLSTGTVFFFGWFLLEPRLLALALTQTYLKGQSHEKVCEIMT
jgi:hypothetical protein